MRKEMEEIKPTSGDYVLVYYKSSVGDCILDALSETKEKVVVFNCLSRKYSFEYREVGSDFINYLAGSTTDD